MKRVKFSTSEFVTRYYEVDVPDRFTAENIAFADTIEWLNYTESAKVDIQSSDEEYIPGTWKEL